MKKSFIIAAMALVVGSLSLPAKAAEDVLIVNLQYVVSQSKSGVSLRKQSEALNKEVVDLRDSISKDLQAKGKKLEDDKTLLAPEVFKRDYWRFKQRLRVNNLSFKLKSKKYKKLFKGLQLQ